MTKLAGTICKVVNCFIVLLCLLTCLVPVLPAGKFWPVALLGLLFPVLFGVVALFFVGWLMARSRWCLLSLAAMVLSWQQLSAIAGVNFKTAFTPAKSPETLRVMTWNLSSWGETSKSNRNHVDYRPMMVDLVKKQQADIICLQEFWDSRTMLSNIRLFKDMGYRYSYFVKTVIDNIDFNIGVVIFSRYPVTGASKFTYGENDYAEHLIYTDIEFNRQKMRVFTTHLQSVRFEAGEYSAISKIKHTDKSGLKDSRTIVSKLKKAYEFRGTQAGLVQQKIKESPYPVIVCGDFNDVPNSYTYFTIRGDLQDAFLKEGTGLGRTFQYLFPTLRIDYILAGKDFKVNQFNLIKTPYSDHYPLVADLTLTRPPISTTGTALNR